MIQIKFDRRPSFDVVGSVLPLWPDPKQAYQRRTPHRRILPRPLKPRQVPPAAAVPQPQA